jgi:hypothetical protein
MLNLEQHQQASHAHHFAVNIFELLLFFLDVRDQVLHDLHEFFRFIFTFDLLPQLHKHVVVYLYVFELLG